MPQSNSAFWKEKLGRNAERDSRNTELLEKLGWRVFVVWECQSSDPVLLEHLAVDIVTPPDDT